MIQERKHRFDPRSYKNWDPKTSTCVQLSLEDTRISKDLTHTLCLLALSGLSSGYETTTRIAYRRISKKNGYPKTVRLCGTGSSIVHLKDRFFFSCMSLDQYGTYKIYLLA